MARASSKRNSMLTEGDEGESAQDNINAPAAKAAKKKDKTPPAAAKRGIGDNIAPLKGEIKNAYDEIEQWKKERKAINDKIKAKREEMEAKGITKTAFDSAMAYINLEPSKREGFDTAYIISREALGLPVKGAQADLFNEEPAVTDAEGDDDGEE